MTSQNRGRRCAARARSDDRAYSGVCTGGATRPSRMQRRPNSEVILSRALSQLFGHGAAGASRTQRKTAPGAGCSRPKATAASRTRASRDARPEAATAPGAPTGGRRSWPLVCTCGRPGGRGSRDDGLRATAAEDPAQRPGPQPGAGRPLRTEGGAPGRPLPHGQEGRATRASGDPTGSRSDGASRASPRRPL